MVKIQQAQNTVGVDRTGLGYLSDHTNEDAFGVGIAKAKQRLGASALEFVGDMSKMNDNIQRTKALELSNYIDELEKERLNNPQDGYYAKLGKDAMADPEDPTKGAMAVLTDIDGLIDQKQRELGLTYGEGLRTAQYVKTKKMDALYRGATKHELDQTQKWGLATNENAKNLAIQKGILHRDNDEDMRTALNNGRVTILQKAKLLHWDQDTTAIEVAKYESDFHSNMVLAYAEEGSLKAKEYYEAHKDKMMVDAQQKLVGVVENVDTNYAAEMSAERLFALYPQDQEAAFAEVDKVENLKDREALERRLSAKYSRFEKIEREEQDNLLDGFYDVVNEKIKNNEPLSDSDIPIGLNGRNQINARNFIDNMNEKGDVDTNNSVYLDLYNMSTTDAQQFKNLNLAQYRPYLSASDYKSFQKKQADIKNMTPTQIQDNDVIMQAGLKAMGYKIDKNTGEAKTALFGSHTAKDSSAYQNTFNAYIRELELKKGKNLTREEIGEVQRNFTANYKENEAAYQKGMNNQVNFMRNLVSDMETAEKTKGSPLTYDEKQKILTNRISIQTQQDNKELSKGNVPQVGDTWFGHRITSLYGGRERPTAGASSFHQGVDLAYKNNEKIGAFASGKVVAVGENNGIGKFVDIQSADGTVHRYGHCNSINVKQGQEVTAGEFIARAGSTGISTGPHLHYQQMKGGKSVNPLGKKQATKIANTKTSTKTASKERNQEVPEGTIIRNKDNVRKIMKGGKWVTI